MEHFVRVIFEKQTGASLPAGFKQVAYNPTTGEFIYYDA